MKTKRRKFSLPKWHGKKQFYKYTVPGVKRSNGRGAVTNTISKSEKRWLDRLGVPMRGVPIKGFGGKIYIVDGFDPRTNTVFEMLGDTYHGGIKAYPTNRDFIVKWLGKTPNQMYQETVLRFRVLSDFGFKIFFVWYSDWEKGKSLGRYYRGGNDNLY